MKRVPLITAAILSSMVVLASCTEEQKPPPTAAAPRLSSAVTTQPGVAGGMTEDSYIVQAIVKEVDLINRHVTLQDSGGEKFTFTAGPEIKNLQHLHVNDKVTATFARRIVVTVRSNDDPASYSRESLEATARVGAKPGMLVAEESKHVAVVTAINSDARTADLKFDSGTAYGVPVRSDVEMSKYKVGDNVIIRVTRALTVLTETPTP